MKEDIELYGGNVLLTFDPDKHRYTVSVGGKPPIWVPSVTGITGMVDDGKANALMGWACNLMAGEIIAKVDDAGYDLDEVSFPDVVKHAKFARKRAVESAATLGTVVHNWCEEHIKYQLGELKKAPMRPRNKKAQHGVDAFLKWEVEAKPEYLFSERKIYSVEHHYAGTFDILANLGGALTVVDIKTSSRVYEEHKFQLAAYTQALNEEFDQQVENRLILHLSRVSPTFTAHDLGREGKYNGLTFEDDLAAFVGARAIYRRLKEIGK